MKSILFYALSGSGKRTDLQMNMIGQEMRWILPHAEIEGEKKLTVCCDAFNAHVGDQGFYLLPGNKDTRGSALTFFREREDCKISVNDPSESLFAVGLKDAVYLVLVERVYRYRCCAEYAGGNYRINLRFDLSIQPPTDDICLNVLKLPATTDYNDIARIVRTRRLERGEIRTLREKCAERPHLEHFRRYPLIRIRMAWKPVPPPVLHQTPENEPPVHVACDFARVRDIADELKRQGVESAQLSLVGWNRKGHDGRWPQIFPVEEVLGGEEELRKTIEYVQSLGFQITCHTNSLDHYEIADIFNWANLAYRSDGTPIQQGKWGGGAAYHACPDRQLRITGETLPAVAELGFAGIHYIDVLSILMPDACYHPDHPVSTRHGMEKMREILACCNELFGGSSSEGNLDYLLGELDFSLYNRFKMCCVPSDNPLVDEYIPLWELIYHGIVLSNPCTQTVNYPAKTPKEAVVAQLLNGKPTFYFYSRFCGDGMTNWMGEDDLTCGTHEELTRSVSLIKQAYDRYCAGGADRQFSYIRSYEQPEEGLYAVTYENGDCLIGNMSDHERIYAGMSIPPHGIIETGA